MFLLLLFFAIAIIAKSELVLLTKRYNDKYVYYIYDSNATTNSSEIVHVYTSGTSVFLAELNYSRSIGARKYENAEHITGPRGCSKYDNTNCVKNSIEAQNNYLDLKANYSKQFNVIEVRDEMMIKSGIGPFCAIPAITSINVKTIVTMTNSTFTMTFESDNKDSVSPDQDILNIYAYYEYRLLIRRLSFRNFSVQFGTVGYTAGSYNIIDQSTFSSTPHNFSGNITFLSGINYTFSAVKSELIDPEVLTEVNFYKNKEMPYYYTTRSVNFQVGGYDSNLRLKNPRCPNLVPCGGYSLFATGELPLIPVAIPPNALYNVYRDDCIEFYPKAATFNKFKFTGNDGGTQQRMVADQKSCFAPFYAPDMIISSTGVEVQDERSWQCKHLGGELSSQAQDVCTRVITFARCPVGWIFFGSRCFNKFNILTQAWAQVTYSESLAVCQSIHPDSKPLLHANFDIKAFLMMHYIYWNDRVTETYRVGVLNSNCNCYNSALVVYNCNCNRPFFPICVMHEKYNEVKDRFISHAPETVKVLRDGQQGSPHTGEMFKTQCFNGFTGDACEEETCGNPISPDIENPLTIFYAKCYANKRGKCGNLDPRDCICSKNYAPAGNLITGEHVDHPCACASAPAATGTNYTINNETYTSTASEKQVPCGGVTKGTCLVDTFSNAGECDCNTRVRVSAGIFNGEVEKAYDGKSCDCTIPKIFTGTDIKQAFCNGKGTCCPHGETLYDGTEECTEGQSGCICKNGVTGKGCTCEAPYNLVDLLPFSNPTKIQFVFGNCTKILIDGLPNKCTVIEPGKYYCPYYVNTIDGCANLTAIYDDWFEPCGNNTNPFAGRFSANPQNRRYGYYAEIQPWYYASKGCTNSRCFCDPQHAYTKYSACEVGISKVYKEDNKKAVCGETTLPQRGSYVEAERKCRCNEVGDGYFTGGACHCQFIDGKMCAGHGTCLEPEFPYGTCIKDLQDYEADSLYYPYNIKTSGSNFSTWFFRENSLVTMLESNTSYLFRNEYTSVSLFRQFGAAFDTCDMNLKFVAETVQMYGADEILANQIEFNLTILRRNGTSFFVVKNTTREYPFCREEWVTSINGTWFNNTGVVECISSYEVIRGNEVKLYGEFNRVELTCVKATTTSPFKVPQYALLHCNDVIDRNIDKALFLRLGGENYTMQCENEPIKAYSNTLGAFYGLFKQFNATRVARVFGNRKMSDDLINEKFFDDYLIEWVSPFVGKQKNITNYGALPNIVKFDDLIDAILLIAEIYSSTALVYDFLDERFTVPDIEEKIGSFARLFPSANGTGITTRDLATRARNHTSFYRRPGINTILQTYRRGGIQRNVSLQEVDSISVNALKIKFPVNLDSISIYARNGTLCGHKLRPRKNEEIDISCGFDPFLYNQEYLDFIEAENSKYLAEYGNESTVFMALTSEGVRVNIVPENFYAIEPTFENLWTVDHYDSCMDDEYIFQTLTDGSRKCQHWDTTNNSKINYGDVYVYDDWIKKQGLNLTELFNNSAQGGFRIYSSWFDVIYTENDRDYRVIWDEYKNDIPLGSNTNGVAIDLVADEEWLKIQWEVHLAPAFCSDHLECSNYAKGATCVFNDWKIPTVEWRGGSGGDGSAIGNEGGCKCDHNPRGGFWINFCKDCRAGYGPSGNCTLPVAYEAVCGPGGASYTVTKHIENVFLPTNGDKAPKCRTLLYKDVIYTIDTDPSNFIIIPEDLFIISYTNGTGVINIINDQVFFNAKLIEPTCVTFLDDDEFYIEAENEFINWRDYISYFI